MIDIRYAQIRECDISNGEGIGVALFVQGCPSPHCKGCFNPETWDFNGGKEWTEEVKNNFLGLANKSYIKRISILGGEPLADENLDDVLNLINEIRILLPEKTIWIYSGYTWKSIIDYKLQSDLLDEDDVFIKNAREDINWIKRKKIISLCDIFVDGRYIDSQRDITLKWCGSSNQRVISVQESLKQNNIVLYNT